jgi:hypothetical protein
MVSLESHRPDDISVLLEGVRPTIRRVAGAKSLFQQLRGHDDSNREVADANDVFNSFNDGAQMDLAHADLLLLPQA